MTVTGDPASPPASSDGVDVRPEPEGAPPSLNAICPYLVAGDGTWQSANPIRDQRCGAVDPPVLLARDKQRDLCLVAAHTGCATYRAALASVADAEPPTPFPATTMPTSGRRRARSSSSSRPSAASRACPVRRSAPAARSPSSR